MHGWIGKIAWVDLSAQTARVDAPAAEFYRQHIGGEALAAELFRAALAGGMNGSGGGGDENGGGLSDGRGSEGGQAGDDAPVVIASGPLAGTGTPCGGFACVFARSPLGGGVLRALVGGSFAGRLKQSGFDALVLTGRAKSPVLLEISQGGVRFAPAGRGKAELINLTATEAAKALAPRGAFLLAGRAAFKNVRFADLSADGYFPAEVPGSGFALAQKNVACVLACGTEPIAINNADALASAITDIRRLIAASPAVSGELGLKNFGTAAFFDLLNERHMLPTANFHETFFSDAHSVNAPALKQLRGLGGRPCPGCPVGCRMSASDGRPFPGLNAAAGFGALLENSDPEFIFSACEVCRENGLDENSAAQLLAAKREFGGEALTAGDMLDTLQRLADGREPELAPGVDEFYRARGEAGRSPCVKGAPLPPCDPRGAYGLALAQATSPTGPELFAAGAFMHEILRKPVATARFSFSGKARIVKLGEDARAAQSSLCACPHAFVAASLEEYSRALSAATGVEFSAADLAAAGERAFALECELNARFGLTGADDRLPGFLFTEPGTAADNFAVPPLDREEFGKTLASYRRVRGGASCKS